MGEIFIGDVDKIGIIKNYISNNSIKKIFVIGDALDLDELNVEYECVKFSDTIMYVYFYRLLQEVNGDSLIVLNECLRKQNRYDLTYNCIKRYVIQTKHRLVFNYYPIIKEEKDFMILYDMLMDNPFLKEKYEYVTKFENVTIGNVEFSVHKTDITIDAKYVEQYAEKKEEIIGQVKKDANIIPRRLLKFSESVNKKYIKKFDSMSKIKHHMNVVVNQTGVDKYYYNELVKFGKELDNVIKRIQGR